MIELAGVSARVGAFSLTDVTFTIPAGAYGVVIGPAGSGKTTLLETIAGVIPARGGELRLSGRDAARLPPEARDLALVYQHGFLFPHLSVRENVAYGAREPDAVQAACDRFEIGPLLDRATLSLSGGERQLVSLARAVARNASILLLDEPFGALDPRRRARTRREVRNLQREQSLTVLQVTHDFAEAGLLGDVAVLLDAGRVLQHGAPDEIFRRPASPYIAEFLGAENVFAGTARILADAAPDWTEGIPPEYADRYHAIEFRTGPLAIYAVGSSAEGPCYAVVRSEEVVLSLEEQPSSARNHFRGRVSEVLTTGAFARVTVDIGGVPLVAALTTRSVGEMQLTAGREVFASFKAMAVHLC